MPRKPRCRCIGGYPDHWAFSPDEAAEGEPIIMGLDEFETIRLLDREGLTQEQCAARMGVARTTVTAIYESARRKLAEALIDGRRLVLRGGSYRLGDQGTEHITEKGTDTMRIAVTYENGAIFQHFGHTEQFKLYDVEGGRIVSEQTVGTSFFLCLPRICLLVLCKFWQLYGGVNGDLLQEDLCHTHTQSPCPCGRPLPKISAYESLD